MNKQSIYIAKYSRKRHHHKTKVTSHKMYTLCAKVNPHTGSGNQDDSTNNQCGPLASESQNAV
jgi:hypothetical protein